MYQVAIPVANKGSSIPLKCSEKQCQRSSDFNHPRSFS